MEFSERLRQLREKHGYTQKQLADAVHLSKNAICNYEKNVNLPNIETLMLLADIFNVPVDYLLGRSAISFKFDKLNKSFFGKFTIAEAIDILSSIDKKSREVIINVLLYAKNYNDNCVNG
jgi:transcriptional regulator with XRE-family HTH domain